MNQFGSNPDVFGLFSLWKTMKSLDTLDSRAWRDAHVSLPFARFTHENLALVREQEWSAPYLNIRVLVHRAISSVWSAAATGPLKSYANHSRSLSVHDEEEVTFRR